MWLKLSMKILKVIAALRVPISYLLLSIVSLDARYAFREKGDVCEEYPTPSFHKVDSFKNASFLV